MFFFYSNAIGGGVGGAICVLNLLAFWAIQTPTIPCHRASVRKAQPSGGGSVCSSCSVKGWLLFPLLPLQTLGCCYVLGSGLNITFSLCTGRPSTFSRQSKRSLPSHKGSCNSQQGGPCHLIQPLIVEGFLVNCLSSQGLGWGSSFPPLLSAPPTRFVLI